MCPPSTESQYRGSRCAGLDTLLQYSAWANRWSRFSGSLIAATNPRYVLAAADGSATCWLSPGPHPWRDTNAKPDLNRAAGSRSDMRKHFGAGAAVTLWPIRGRCPGRFSFHQAVIRTWCRWWTYCACRALPITVVIRSWSDCVPVPAGSSSAHLSSAVECARARHDRRPSAVTVGKSRPRSASATSCGETVPTNEGA